MAFGFPLYIDLNGNNCVVLGGGDYAADKVDTLLQFGAKVTVISPALCGPAAGAGQNPRHPVYPPALLPGRLHQCLYLRGCDGNRIGQYRHFRRMQGQGDPGKRLQARRLWKLRIPPVVLRGNISLPFRQRAAGAAIPPAGFAGEPAARVAAGAGRMGSGSRFRRIQPIQMRKPIRAYQWFPIAKKHASLHWRGVLFRSKPTI